MKKIIVGVVSFFLFSGIVYASNIGYREFSIKVGMRDANIAKFVDPDNGNICYVLRDGRGEAISCIKP